jgi:hypothetical protein
MPVAPTTRFVRSGLETADESWTVGWSAVITGATHGGSEPFRRRPSPRASSDREPAVERRADLAVMTGDERYDQKPFGSGPDSLAFEFVSTFY